MYTGSEKLASANITDIMQTAYIDYSMSVIISRALPDARDGLKPVQRRILYAMLREGLQHNRPYTKCAGVVGEVLKNYHPHGDASVYDTLVRLAQPWVMRYLLIDPQGNFGSVDGDPPAAYRYTECRLAETAEDLLRDIDEETVDFIANYDGTAEEPTVLPARFPNMLVNGSQGIAVGMATNIPPHNMGEVIDATTHLLEHPDATPDDLMEFIKGPDFPTGALILGRQGILDALRTGRGSIKLRAVAEIEEGRDGATRIVISEMPYQTSIASVSKKIEDLVRAGDLDGIAEAQDDSSGGKTRLVIRLKRDANANVVLNNLFKQTPMQTTFSVNAVALVDGVPRTLNVAQMLTHYVAHQVEVVTRRSQFLLKKAQDRAHVVEGLLKAIDMLDQVIATIRGSDDRPAALEALCATPFDFSEEQANHILDMTLARLTRLGRTNLEEELAKLLAEIAELESILSDDAKLRGVIAGELGEIREKFANERRTIITHDPGDMNVEDLVDDEEIVVTMSRAGYIKAVSADSFRTQARGGRGVQGAKLKEEDLIDDVVHTSSHAHLLLFSNRGRVFRLRALEIPVKERAARGTAIVNLLPLAPSESIQAIIGTRDFPADNFLVFATKHGQIKKTAFSEYDKSRREGFIAINLRDGDELVRVVETHGDDDVFIVTSSGMTIRFSEQDVRAMGRDAAGVRGVRLKPEDEVVSCDIARDEADILIVTDAGYGKRTKVDRFNSQARGGQGVRGIKLTAKRGRVVAAFMAGLEDELLLISTSGVVIRTSVREIASQGRDATGVRVMNLGEGDAVAAVAPVAGESGGDA